MDLIIQHLNKSYPQKTVLADFSAVFKERSCNVIMGPSGCGKTTLLHILMNFIKPDSGTINGLPEHISAVFQEDRLCEDFDAVTNIRITAAKTVSESQIIYYLTSLGLEESIRQPLYQLSGGMKRRVAILRALMANAELILMDEPFKGLDTHTKIQVINFIKEHIENKTVIIVTHDEAEAAHFVHPSQVVHMK